MTQFIPSESIAVSYAKELSKYIKNLKSLDRTKNWSRTELEKAAYSELRNCHRELFENSQEWRVTIMRKYRFLEEDEAIKEKSSENNTPAIGNSRGYENPIEKKLNPHDSDNDEEFTGTLIIPQTEDGGVSPVQEGRVNVNYISKEEYRKKLEDEHNKRFPRGMMR